jgi:hypothetical protein
MLLAFFMLSPLAILALVLFARRVDPETGHFIDKKQLTHGPLVHRQSRLSVAVGHVRRNTQVSAGGLVQDGRAVSAAVATETQVTADEVAGLVATQRGYSCEPGDELHRETNTPTAGALPRKTYAAPT